MSRPLRTVLVTVVLIALVFAAGGGYAVFGPNTPAFEGKRGVKIPPGSAFETVLDSLSSSGVIASPMMVGLLGNATGWGDQVKAGYYEFEAGASSFDVLSTLRRGLQTPIRVRIPQGSRLERIAEVAGREMAFGPDAFYDALRSDSLADAVGVPTPYVLGVLVPESEKVAFADFTGDIDYSNKAEDRLTCSYQGDDIQIGFNSRFLVEMLNNLNANEVQLEMSLPNRAGILTPVDGLDEGEEVTMLVMPVMLNN